MDEVDRIIICQLKEINAPIEDDKNSLQELDSNEVVLSAAHCLSLILPNGNADFGKITASNLNMATKYKIATHLAAKCQELGYKGDIGYQSFLYGTESDVRRILSFLIDKLPKEDALMRDVVADDTSLQSKLKKSGHSMIWVPPTFPDSYEPFEGIEEPQTMTGLINSKSILGNKIAPKKKKYYDQFLKIPLDDVSSLIEFNRSHLNPSSSVTAVKSNVTYTHVDYSSRRITDPIFFKPRKSGPESQTTETVSESSHINEREEVSVLVRLQHELTTSLDDLKMTEKDIETTESEIERLKFELKTENELLLQAKSQDRTTEELEAAVNTLKFDIQNMNEQWTEIQTELLKELEKAQNLKAEKFKEFDLIRNQLLELKRESQSKSREGREKESLVEELKSLIPDPFPPGRNSYTKRILEIINNIKKLDQETKKVLSQTKEVQKEINTLSGKVQRAFSVADESIYRGAKVSEFHRRCYKLLANVHETSERISQGMESIGSIRRQILNLEELVDKELSNKIESKLSRIQSDYNQLKLVNQNLAEQLVD